MYIYCCASSFIHEIIILFFYCYTWTKLNILTIVQSLHTELGQSLSDFGKAVNLLGACEGNALGKVFSELGAKSEILSIKLQKEVSLIVGSCIFVKQYWSSVKWNISLWWYSCLCYHSGPPPVNEFWRAIEGLCSCCAIYKGKVFWLIQFLKWYQCPHKGFMCFQLSMFLWLD